MNNTKTPIERIATTYCFPAAMDEDRCGVASVHHRFLSFLRLDDLISQSISADLIPLLNFDLDGVKSWQDVSENQGRTVFASLTPSRSAKDNISLRTSFCALTCFIDTEPSCRVQIKTIESVFG